MYSPAVSHSSVQLERETREKLGGCFLTWHKTTFQQSRMRSPAGSPCVCVVSSECVSVEAPHQGLVLTVCITHWAETSCFSQLRKYRNVQCVVQSPHQAISSLAVFVSSELVVTSTANSVCWQPGEEGTQQQQCLKVSLKCCSNYAKFDQSLTESPPWQCQHRSIASSESSSSSVPDYKPGNLSVC